MYNLLRDRFTGMKRDVVDFAAELVRIPSISLQEKNAAECVERVMKNVGFDRVIRDNAGNVVGLMLGIEKQPTLVLNGHLDTVAAGSPGEWENGPCSGHTDRSHLYGLGSSDCKGGVAAQIYAAALLKRSLLPLRGNLVVAATVAEENGCSVGIQTLLEDTLPSLNLKPSWIVLAEPTSLGLYYGHDGWVEIDVRIDGPSRLEALEIARNLLNDQHFMEERSVMVAGKAGSAAAEGGSFPENAVGFHVAQRLGSKENHGHAVARVSEAAASLVDTLPGVRFEVKLAEEKQTLYTGRQVAVKRICNSWETDPYDPLMTRARQALLAVGFPARVGKWELGRLGMGTAGSHCVNQHRIPTIGFGPGIEAMAHTANEQVPISHLHDAVFGTAAIAHSLIGIPVCGWTSEDI